MTAGRLASATIRSTRRSARTLLCLVSADGISLIERRGLVGRCAIFRQAQRRDARSIDDALDASFQRRLHDGARAVDVRCKNLRRVRRPKPIVGRDMEDVTDAVHDAVEKFGVADVALDDVEIEPFEIGPVAAASNKRPNDQPFAQELACDRRANEASSSCQKCNVFRRHARPPHSCAMFTLTAFARRSTPTPHFDAKAA